MSLIDRIHGGYVFKRRVRVLSTHLARLIPQNARVLDVGCGDGLIAKLIHEHRPDVQLEGIDVLIRPQTHIPVTQFDGKVIPHDSKSFDAVMFVDVLHHTDDPMILLREAVRVARRAVVIKDHRMDGLLAGPTLRFMDWVGNARHGVVLPYNYWPEARWAEGFRELGWREAERVSELNLYPPPASWFFDRSLHFITRLEPTAP
ncbi:MAG: class I SAM-dependent methyltransferase [Verrucomicrobiota bacterium]